MKRHRFLPWLVLFGVSAIALVLWWPSPAPRPVQQIEWREATQTERMAAIRSIQSQLKAFRSNDYKTAVKYQSSGLQRNFTSLEAFRTMMRRRYPQFTNYQSADFGVARADPKGTRVLVPIELTGRDKVKVRALYIMVKENQVFRVEGVMGGLRAMQPSPRNRPSRPMPADRAPATVDL